MRSTGRTTRASAGVIALAAPGARHALATNRAHAVRRLWLVAVVVGLCAVWAAPASAEDEPVAVAPAAASIDGKTEVAPDRRDGPSAQIVDGYVPHPSQWPWMAAIGHSRASEPSLGGSSRQYCGGALIAPRVVLTAAHCLYDGIFENAYTPPALMSVVIGRRNLDTETGGEEHGVSTYVLHPNYSSATFQNDAAVLQLGSPSTQPTIGLDPGFALMDGNRATVMGWGDRFSGSRAGHPDLLAADVPLWASTRCSAAYASFFVTHDPATMLCGGSPEGGNNSCQGDSGGPLAIPDQAGTWKQIGIVSWADGCAKAGRPTNFTWVGAPSMKPWIQSVAAQYSMPVSAPVPAAPDSAPAPAARTPAPVGTPPTTGPPAIRITLLSARGRVVSFTLSGPAKAAEVVARGRLGGRTRTLAKAYRRNLAAGLVRMRLPRIRRATGTYVRVTVQGTNGTTQSRTQLRR